MLASTPKGATSSAILFSLIQMATGNDLNPYNSLTQLLNTAQDADLVDAPVAQNLGVESVILACRSQPVLANLIRFQILLLRSKGLPAGCESVIII